jgi:hypothetical protein
MHTRLALTRCAAEVVEEKAGEERVAADQDGELERVRVAERRDPGDGDRGQLTAGAQLDQRSEAGRV